VKRLGLAILLGTGTFITLMCGGLLVNRLQIDTDYLVFVTGLAIGVCVGVICGTLIHPYIES